MNCDKRPCLKYSLKYAFVWGAFQQKSEVACWISKALNHDLEIIRVLSEFGISFGYTRNNMYFWKNLAIISEKQGLLREALEFWSKSVEVMLFAFEDREVEDLQYHSHVSYLSIDGEIISDSEELLDSYCIPINHSSIKASILQDDLWF